MLHVLTTLLATALLASSTGANAAKNYETHEEQNKTALRAGPKMAYYDPAETYGTTAGYFYNYAENAQVTEATIESGQSGYYFSTRITAENITSETNFPYYDFYSNGELLVTKKGVYNGSATFYIVQLDLRDYFELQSSYPFHITEDPLPYIWIFDHEEADPIEEMNENIFEAVGDTITGLSNALASPWDGILNIFYDTSENEVTQMGYLVLIGLGVSVTLLVFWTILRLFKQRN